MKNADKAKNLLQETQARIHRERVNYEVSLL
jgi:hypothetical protein